MQYDLYKSILNDSLASRHIWSRSSNFLIYLHFFNNAISLKIQTKLRSKEYRKNGGDQLEYWNSGEKGRWLMRMWERKVG
jgi:hypothetical protein